MKQFGWRGVVGILVLSVAVWSALSILPAASNQSLPLVREDNDFGVFFSGRGWVQRGQILLQDGYAEYPPLALVYITWPRLVTDSFEGYHWLLWLINAAMYVAGGILTWSLCQRIQLGPARLLWLAWLLPSVVFYSLNRFDVFPMVLALLSLWLALSDKWCASWFVWGLAVITKLYPILLLPLWLVLARRRGEKFWPATIYGLIGPLTLTLAEVISAGGAAIIKPYLVQASRVIEPGSTIWVFLQSWYHHAGVYKPNWQMLIHIGQLLLPAWWLYGVTGQRNFKGEKNHLVLAALTLLLLIGLHPFYSNQWWLWVLPFIIFVVPWRWAWLVVVYDLLNYLQFPLVVYYFGKFSAEMELVVWARSLAWLVLVVVIWQQLPKKWWTLDKA
ncbi:MAG: DUF2029 domain-containing protein [Candidatus Kerfeldbacteria bacterium]|nr:DUF2029 domain-containing protein [Candidatus Kerfeldbacteria bacterium]